MKYDRNGKGKSEAVEARRQRGRGYGGDDPISDELYEADRKPERDESCNEYYTRKQQPNINQISGDADLPLQGRDDSFAEERNYGERDRSHINQKLGRNRSPKGAPATSRRGSVV